MRECCTVLMRASLDGLSSVTHACILIFPADINECSESRFCQDICTNTNGSFVCSCSEGLTLDHNYRTCSGMGGVAIKLFYGIFSLLLNFQLGYEIP